MNEIKYDTNKIIEEILNCLKDGYYLAALMEALVLPDICCKIEKKQTNQKFYYSDWCNRWLKLPELSMDMGYKGTWGNILFQLRCGVLHNAEIDVINKNYVFFNLENFKLYIEDSKSDVINALRIDTHSYTGGYREQEENNVQHVVDIEIHYLINIIIAGVYDFAKAYDLNSKDFPNINIELKK